MGFGSISAQAVRKGKTVELVLNQLTILGEHPVLIVEHLGETNEEFWSEAISRAGQQVNAAQDGRGAISQADIERIRQENRAIVARHAVRGTRGFFHDFPDRPGVPDPARPASTEDTREIVFALPADVFDSVLLFVRNEQNFRDRPLTDARELAGK